jgi:hypothetical protein
MSHAFNNSRWRITAVNRAFILHSSPSTLISLRALFKLDAFSCELKVSLVYKEKSQGYIM